jgi:hypothetical protein
LRSPGGLALNIVRPQIGEMKRIWLQANRPITFTVAGGSVGWGRDTPVYGSGTVISLLCVDASYIVGSTLPVG